MTHPLSPAAQAVIDAMSGVYAMNCPTAPALACSVIYAVVDQVVPEEMWLETSENCYAHYSQRRITRRQFLAIATELESVNA